jgi:hypoxanthine phosphoribosyltransferase
MYTLLTPDQIARRVTELGTIITDVYRNRPLTILGVLNGSLIFVADLMRSIDIPHRVGFVHASSYRGTTTVPGDLTVATGLMPDIAHRDVLLVDDIFDTGRTLLRLLTELENFRPSSVRTAVLLWKEGRSEVEIEPAFHGFRIPNEFVVGYGLDYNDDYRHLPEVAVLESGDLP